MLSPAEEQNEREEAEIDGKAAAEVTSVDDDEAKTRQAATAAAEITPLPSRDDAARIARTSRA